MNRSLIAAAVVLLLTACLHAAEPHQRDLFYQREGGYHTYRIPATIVTAKNSVLVFCEGRKNGQSDSGDIDLLMRRSTDGGKTFSDFKVVWDDGKNTCGNPCPILDRETGVIHLLMTHNLGEDKEPEITRGTARGTRTVWATQSSDDGETWSKPVDITKDVKKEGWTWYATGPGNGIQTKSGRLVVPCDHKTANDEWNSHVFYSDDHGKSWKLGGVAGPETNESRVVELSDGRLLLNMRTSKSTEVKARGISHSSDAGVTWSDVTHDKTLPEPRCQGTLIRLADKDGKARFLFANPASDKRDKMTVRLSTDDCKTWEKSKLLNAGSSAYSDAVELKDGTILVVYERGEGNAYQRITLARFRMDWLAE